MKINTKKEIVDLAGKGIEVGDGKFYTVGIALSNILLGAKQGGQMKLFTLAQKCFSDEFVEVDKADISLIKKAIEDADKERFNNLITGQLLIMLDELKDIKDEQ